MFAIDYEDFGTPVPNCPEYKVTAVEVVLVSQKGAWKKRTADERALPRPGRRSRQSPATA